MLCVAARLRRLMRGQTLDVISDGGQMMQQMLADDEHGQLCRLSRLVHCQTQLIKSASRWGPFWVGKEAAGQAGTRARLLGSAIRKPRRLKSSLL